MKKSINKITLVNLISMILLNAISFVTSPIFSRLLGTGNYGIISVYATWNSIVIALFGLQTDSTLGVARSSFPMEEQQKYQSSVLSLSVISYLILSAGTILILTPVTVVTGLEKELILLILIQGIGQICVQFLSSKFAIEFDAVKNLALSLATVILNVLLSLLLVMKLPKEINYYGRAIGQAGVFFAAGIICLIYIIVKGRTVFSRRYWLFCLPLSIPIIFHRLSIIILNSCDKIMIKQLMTDSEAGIYSLALSYATIISALWTAFNNAWVPFYYEFERTGKKEKIITHSKNYIEFFSVLTIGFLLLSPEVFHIYAGKPYWSGERLVPILVEGFYFVFMYSFPVNCEFYHKKTKLIAIGTVLAAIFNIILNYIMITKFGAIGASFATAAAHLIQFSFHYMTASRILGKKQYPYSIKMLGPWIILVSFVSIVSYYTGNEAAVFRWITGAAIGIYELIKIIKRKSIF